MLQLYYPLQRQNLYQQIENHLFLAGQGSPLQQQANSVLQSLAMEPVPAPTLAGLHEAVNRRGMEEQALELELSHRRTKLDLATIKDELRRAHTKIDQLESALGTAQSKNATMDSVKDYSLELQSRLAFSERQAEDRRVEASALREELATMRRELDSIFIIKIFTQKRIY